MPFQIETKEQDEWRDQFAGSSPFLSPIPRREAHARLDVLHEVLGNIPREITDLLDELLDDESSAAGRIARWLSAVMEG